MSSHVKLTLEEYMACVYRVFGPHTLPDLVVHYTRLSPANSHTDRLKLREYTRTLHTATSSLRECGIDSAENIGLFPRHDDQELIINEEIPAAPSKWGMVHYHLRGKKPNAPPLSTDHLSESERALLLFAIQTASQKQAGKYNLCRYLRNISKRRAKKNVEYINRYLSNYRAILKLTNIATLGRGFIRPHGYIVGYDGELYIL